MSDAYWTPLSDNDGRVLSDVFALIGPQGETLRILVGLEQSIVVVNVTAGYTGETRHEDYPLSVLGPPMDQAMVFAEFDAGLGRCRRTWEGGEA